MKNIQAETYKTWDKLATWNKISTVGHSTRYEIVRRVWDLVDVGTKL
jgi:hypothetical protein